MTPKGGVFFFAILFIIMSFRNYYDSVVSGELVVPRFPSVNSAENLHSMKKMKRGVREMEFCIGRRCARRRENEHTDTAGVFVCVAIASLIGLFALLRARKPERSCPRRFGSFLHSTDINSMNVLCRCDCSSLSPSPSPIPSPMPKLSPRPVRSVSNYFEDNLVWFEDFQGVSPLPTSPPKLGKGFSDSSSSSDIFPIVPPRRWRGNSKLNLAQSPEVLPTKERRIPSFQVNNVSI